MYVPFEQLPPHARVWIYQSEQAITAGHEEAVRNALRQFCDQWEVHGMPLTTSFAIRYDHFIVLGADETDTKASGCSIDSSVHLMKQISQFLSVDLFDRSKVGFMLDRHPSFLPLTELKKAFASGIINAGSLSFNNLVDTKAALDNAWLKPAGETWLKRYISVATPA